VLDIVKRLREPVAVVVLVALALRLVGGVVTLLLPAARGGYGSLESASRWAAQTFTDPLTAVVLVLLVGACLAWEPTPRARLLAQLGVAVIGIGAVLSLVFAVVGIAGNDDIVWVPELLLVLVRLVIPLLAGVVMYRLLAGSTEHRTAVPAVTQSPSSAGPASPPGNPTRQPVPSGRPPARRLPARQQPAGVRRARRVVGRRSRAVREHLQPPVRLAVLSVNRRVRTPQDTSVLSPATVVHPDPAGKPRS
jgi:hypothetical protein